MTKLADYCVSKSQDWPIKSLKYMDYQNWFILCTGCPESKFTDTHTHTTLCAQQCLVYVHCALHPVGTDLTKCCICYIKVKIFISAVCPLMLVVGVSLGREYNLGKVPFSTSLFYLYVC